MQTYLNKERIKSIAAYLNRVLPKSTVKVFRDFEAKGIEFIYDSDNSNELQNNHIQVWKYYTKKFKEEGDNGRKLQYDEYERQGQWEYCNQLVDEFIHNKYLVEYETFVKTNIKAIYSELNGITSIRVALHLQPINIKEIFHCDNYEKYLDEHYGEKSVNPELLKETERIAKMIDSQYYGRRGYENYSRYQNAVKEYMISGDVNLFHNLLNIE